MSFLQKIIKEKNKTYTSIILLLCIILLKYIINFNSFIHLFTDDFSYSISAKTTYSTLTLIPVIILILFKNKYWKYVYLAILIFYLSGLINFLNFYYKIGINRLSINLIPLIFIIIHIYCNDDLSKLFSSILPKRNNSFSTEKKINEDKVEHFKLKFETKTDIELTKMQQDKSLIIEAKEAARIILEARKNNI